MSKKKRNALVDYLGYLGLRVVISIIQAIPVDMGARLMRFAAWILGDVFKVRYKVTDENLQHAFPEMSADERRKIIRGMWEHLFLLVLEVAHAPRKIHETNWRDYVELENSADAVRALLDERPTMLVTAHFGNFEVAGVVLAILGFPTYSIARPLDNPYVDRYINQFRGSTGQHIIAKHGEYERIEEILASGEAMAFLADQYAGPKGCWVEFFGRKASAHKAIALLSIANDAPMVITAAKRTAPLHFCISVPAVRDPRTATDDVGSIKDLTQWYTLELEKFIRATPSQYWWLHRRWKDTRAQDKARRKQRRAA